MAINCLSKKRALITGINGQDGTYLAELLLDKGYEIHGIVHSSSGICHPAKNRLASISVIDLTEPNQLAAVVQKLRPQEIYYLAATHFSSQGNGNRSVDLQAFVSVNLLAPSAALEVMRRELFEAKFFYAASCHIFGYPNVCPQTESTPQRPEMPYGITKAAGLNVCRYYREHHDLYTSVGILYNHESPRRGESFVTTQIARAAAKASLGKGELLYLKDLNATVDWGAAQDYVEAMWLTLQQDLGDDYVISSGVPRTVRDFANEAFKYLRLCADDYVIQSAEKRPASNLPYIGDSSKIRQACGWRPLISFSELVRSMVNAQRSRIMEGSKGA